MNLNLKEELKTLSNQYDDEQISEILKGIRSGVNVEIYSKPEYTWYKMEVIRNLLEIDQSINFSVFDFQDFSDEEIKDLREYFEEFIYAMKNIKKISQNEKWKTETKKLLKKAIKTYFKNE